MYCEVVASTDGASAHTAHCLLRARIDLRTNNNFTAKHMAARACPTESTEVAETITQKPQTGYQSPRRNVNNQYELQTGLASKNNYRTTDKCSSPSRNPSQHIRSPRSIPFQSLYFQTINLTQRSSSEGSLVHVPN